MTNAPAAPEPSADDVNTEDAPHGRDAWGYALLEPPGLLGQYKIRSWRTDGRVVFVCGAALVAADRPGSHVPHWRLDGRLAAGQGYLCEMCWPHEAQQWGKW